MKAWEERSNPWDLLRELMLDRTHRTIAGRGPSILRLNDAVSASTLNIRCMWKSLLEESPRTSYCGDTQFQKLNVSRLQLSAASTMSQLTLQVQKSTLQSAR
jgi:hypothetical protein